MKQKMCQECGQNAANVHLTQVTDGETVVSYLCEECARKKGISVSVGVADEPASAGAGQDSDRECPRCRLKFSEFRQHGRLGCAQCYSSFEEEIDGLLIQVHGSRVHKGKRYESAAGDSAPAADVVRLREELRNAVECEKFERAAVIRDEIHSLEKLRGEDHCSP